MQTTPIGEEAAVVETRIRESLSAWVLPRLSRLVQSELHEAVLSESLVDGVLGPRLRLRDGRCGVVFRCHSAFCRRLSWCTVERPAAVFLMTPRPLCTGVVQQALPDVLPSVCTHLARLSPDSQRRILNKESLLFWVIMLWRRFGL
jgi:hypothetical protein